MAEKYGEKPTIFTPGWWPYFWMYYKWHTIITAFVAVCAISLISQCRHKVTYDLTAVYAGRTVYDSTVTDKLTDAIKGAVADADGDGEVNVMMDQINFSSETNDNEIDYSLQIKHDIELGQGTYALCFYDKAEAEAMAAREDSESMYVDVNAWAAEPGRVLCSADGVPRLVDLSGNRFMEEIGMDTSDLYMAVGATISEDETVIAAHRNAEEAARVILSEQ